MRIKNNGKKLQEKNKEKGQKQRQSEQSERRKLEDISKEKQLYLTFKMDAINIIFLTNTQFERDSIDYRFSNIQKP